MTMVGQKWLKIKMLETSRKDSVSEGAEWLPLSSVSKSLDRNLYSQNLIPGEHYEQLFLKTIEK